MLDGKVGVVRIVATQVGNNEVFPAAPVKRAFPVGDAWPRPPSQLTADPLATDSVRLRWQSAAEDAIGHRIEQSDDGRTWRSIAKVAPGQTAYDVKGVNLGATARFRVIAFNQVLASPPSNVAER